MFYKTLPKMLPVVVLMIVLSGCSTQATVEIIPVTVVPPVNYPPTRVPVLPPTSMPTAIPFATPTANIDVEQQRVIEVRAGEVDDNELWEEYLDYRSRYRGAYVHDVYITEEAPNYSMNQ